MILGVIADDFTGATDVASMLARLGAGGCRMVVVDAVDGADLEHLAGACADHALVTADRA